MSIGYDNANRRTSLTLPNGVVAAYGYDAASRVTSITYTQGQTTLGNLTYTYDANGRRVQMGGSLAAVNLPAALSSASYNANNQLTQWGAATLTYDLNGNLTNDGTASYTWNARNQLAAFGATSFAYDAAGRRTRNASGAAFLYDGGNAVQELSGSTVTANLLTGLGVDEIFTRTDSAGARNFLTDGLNSTLGLTDSSGTVQTQYTYEPFGKTTASGAASTSTFQYTGRENDGTGLYYYRARYYNPTLGRFVSEDPAGLGGGDFQNLYGYVKNNPLNYYDPFGLATCPTAACTVTPGNGFGAPRPGGTTHNGADLPNPYGGPIVAPESGTIRIVLNSGAGGNEVLVITPTGTVWGNAHTSGMPGLQNGQLVTEGQQIGFTDGSGDSRGYHDHLTYRPCGTCDRIDPMPQFQNSASSSPALPPGSQPPPPGWPPDLPWPPSIPPPPLPSGMPGRK